MKISKKINLEDNKPTTKTFMKNGWIIQKENTPTNVTIKATKEKIHKDKKGNIVGHSNIYRELSFSKTSDIEEEDKEC